jgi:hypothetical protein
LQLPINELSIVRRPLSVGPPYQLGRGTRLSVGFKM